METLTTRKNPISSSNSYKDIIIFSICMLCMFLFLFSAYDKIIGHEKFYNGLSKIKYIGPQAWLISWSVPIIEIAVSILLIIPRTQKIGLFGFAVVMILFTIYVASIWFWAEKVPCHCNLIIDKLTWGEHIWFNLLFIGLAGIALLFSNSNLKS